jgi:predicted transcriptional regulator
MSKHLQSVIQKMSQNMTQVEIAKELGISQPAISLMLKRVKFCPHCHKPLFKESSND